MNYAADFAAAVADLLRYAKSDRRRFYPGGDHLRSFDDPRLGELLAAYKASGSEADHNALLSHLRETQPLANHLLDYADMVGGVARKPQVSDVATSRQRNWITNELEQERGAVQLYHSRLPAEGQSRLDEPRGDSLIHLTVSHPHQGRTYLYRLTVPNFHPEQLQKPRTAGQRQSEERMRRRRLGL